MTLTYDIMIYTFKNFVPRLAGRAGPIVNFLLKALMCCLWCLEKVLKFINWNAYIMIGKETGSFISFTM